MRDNTGMLVWRNICKLWLGVVIGGVIAATMNFIADVPPNMLMGVICMGLGIWAVYYYDDLA
jgi:hypothetical protein